MYGRKLSNRRYDGTCCLALPKFDVAESVTLPRLVLKRQDGASEINADTQSSHRPGDVSELAEISKLHAQAF